MKEIYIDNAATTKINEEVLDEMIPYFTNYYGNPSSLHNFGIIAKNTIDESKNKISKILNCNSNEIIFTGSGTESDNLAILGYCRRNKNKGNHIITTTIEHKAVLESFKKLKKEGFEITYLKVNREGIINIEELKKSIKKETIFISIIYANNEIGVIQDIKTISEICKKKNVTIHIDACQATNYLDIDVKKLNVDLMTISGSKIYGPKGIGILYKNKNIEIEPIIYGGGQENNLRSGTENIPYIVGITKALELNSENKELENKRLTKLRNKLIEGLLEISETHLNGSKNNRLPNNVNISFLNIEGESLLLMLNEFGIYASTGSACSSKNLDASHVVLALDLPIEIAHSSIRFSLGKETTNEDIDYIIKQTKEIVKKLRNMSPLKLKIENIIKKEK